MGDYTSLLQRIQPGTAVFAEGPYGAFTDDRRTAARVVLIAGGIGITPLRALLEQMPAAPGALTLVYRASSWEDVIFRRELDALIKLRHADVIYLVGRRGSQAMPTDPLAPDALLSVVPDIASADVFMCGPLGMQETVRRSLRTLGVPASRLHGERFAY
jgi:ferredoxin-NADP reductase